MIGLEKIELDRIPAAEASLTNRKDWRPILAKLEARLFRRQIIQQFGKDELEANSVSVRVKIHYWDYTEPEVVVSYDPNCDSSVKLAFRIESDCWVRWTPQNAKILRFANNLTDEQLENSSVLDDKIVLGLMGDWE